MGRYPPVKIYVGSLPPSATEEDIRELFGRYGAVISARLVTDQETGSSRGFAYVEMSDSHARTAISALNGSVMDGHNLLVNEAPR